MESNDGELEVDSSDIIHLILQFLRENRLFSAMRALQRGKSTNKEDLECSSSAMMDLYELVALEMMESSTQPERYRLQKMAEQACFDPSKAFHGSSKQKRRDEVAQAFCNEVSTIEPSRLLVLLGQALKWQQLQGVVAPGEDFDLFRGRHKERVVDRLDKLVQKPAGKIKFSKTSMLQCAQIQS
ncbi:unnamed protein product [Peronospora belbahrii]|uniref:TPL/SMU1 LisH-like dimerisation domain-containing protein n=1 Tax=Peronospora belbahrii TaxID=622444 RepID=A0ABN8D0Q9_9STRA|nr:unnamed protein product [Peronospora belbahrii]